MLENIKTIRSSGVSSNSIPNNITKRVLNLQNKDGGWTSIVDTMWNIKYLELLNNIKHNPTISKGKEFINLQKNKKELWGRSKRDFSRIPVTGILFYLFPEFATKHNLKLLEELWESELNSIVYKAGYSLMAYKKNNYFPQEQIKKTCEWLCENQRDNGGFAPWLEHPVDANVFCSSIASLGLLQYPEYIDKNVFLKAYDWFNCNRLASGLWKYHEIEDGASWGIYAITELKKQLQ